MMSFQSSIMRLYLVPFQLFSSACMTDYPNLGVITPICVGSGEQSRRPISISASQEQDSKCNEFFPTGYKYII